MRKLNIQLSIRYLIYTLILFTPLIFTSNTIEGFEFPKMVFIYITGTTIIYLCLVRDTKINLRLTLFPTLFICSYIISTVLSTHLYTSLWGYYSRFNGGLISFLVYYGLYLSSKQYLNKDDFTIIRKLIVLGSIPVSAFGITQYLILNNDQTLLRIFSSIGQANWLGAYLTFCILISLWFVFREDKWVKYFVVFIFGLLAINLTFSVSALIGLLVGIIYFAVYNFTKVVTDKRKGLLILLSTILIIILFPGIWKQRIEDVFSSISFIETVYAQEIKKFNISDSGLIRKGMWEGSVKIISSSPKVFLLGTGPETFAYEFQKQRPAFLNFTSEWEYILNKPHNYYLEIWAANGVLGLLTYLGLLIFAFKKTHYSSKPALLSLYIINLFSWPITVLNLFFWVLLADENNN